MSKITIKQGDLLDATEDVICHQVNCSVTESTALFVK